jgi:hypothetical protein
MASESRPHKTSVAFASSASQGEVVDLLLLVRLIAVVSLLGQEERRLMPRGIVRELVAAEVVYQVAKSWQSLRRQPPQD